MAFAIWRRQLREGPAARLPTRHQDLLAKPAPSQDPHWHRPGSTRWGTMPPALHARPAVFDPCDDHPQV